MDISFLTLPQYDGKILKPQTTKPATGGAAAHAWEEDASEGPYRPIFKKVREILAKRGEQVIHLARYQYDDLNGFGNTLYRVDGSNQQYFLKILGDKQGNRREIFAWRILGYGRDGKRDLEKGTWIKGLPAEVFAMPPLNAILTRYYPGQIHTIRGGRYEFPLVMALVLYLDETLRGLHNHGLMFMDLCPDNILYLEDDPNRPMLFFLTDMGSVKPITGREGEDQNWRELRDLVTPERWTRAEARPPEELFPQRSLQISEDHPGYDDHTLARTALLLMGFGQRFQMESLDLSAYGESFNLEQPCEPTLEEMKTFLDILRPPLRGEKIDRERLYLLFCQFFSKRAEFAGRQIGGSRLRDSWLNQLKQRLTRYKMVLGNEEKQSLPALVSNCLQTEATEVEGSISQAYDQLERLCDTLKVGDLETAAELIPKIETSSLIKVCPTARYALQFHAKVLRALAREQQKKLASGPLHFGQDMPEQIPETKTLKALRRGAIENFGTLKRRID